jgi:hypothetical protein
MNEAVPVVDKSTEAQPAYVDNPAPADPDVGTEYIEQDPLEEGTVYEEPVQRIPELNQQSTDVIDTAALTVARGSKVDWGNLNGYDYENRYKTKTSEERAIEHRHLYEDDVVNDVNRAIALGQEVDPTVVATDLQIAHKASMGVFGGFRAEVDSHPNAKYMTPAEKDQVAVINYLQANAAKVLDEMDWTDWAGDISAMVFSPDLENIRLNQVADIIGLDYKMKDAINYADFFGRMSAHIRTLPPEEAVTAIDELTRGWEGILGDNRLMLAATLADLTGDYAHDSKVWEARLGVADQLATGGAWTIPLVKAGTTMLKGVNVINKSVKMKNVKALSDIVKDGVQGKLTGNGVDIEDAAATITPIKAAGDLTPGADNSLALDIVKEQQKVQIHLDQIDKVNNYGLGLDELEQDEAITNAIKALEEQEELVGVTEVSRDSKGFVVKYETGIGDDKFMTERNMSYQVTDTGIFISDGVSGHSPWNFGVTSPNFRFTADRKSLVQIPEQLQNQAAFIRESYDFAIKAAVGDLSTPEFKRLDGLLIYGDESEKLFTRDELLSGVEGIQYTPKEVEAYLGVRQVVEHMYHAKNKQILETWNATGVKLTEWGGQTHPMKVYEEPQAAITGFRQADTHSRLVVMHSDEGTIRFPEEDIDPDFLIDMYGEGYQLTRVSNNSLLNLGDTHAEWALVHRGDLRDPSGVVLGQRAGYMPKIRKNGHFFVKKKTQTNIAGRDVSTSPETKRYFDNHADAKLWRDRQDGAEDYKIVADGELSASDREDEYINISGGLFTGARSSNPIPFGLEEQTLTGSRRDALHGLQRYVNHLAKQMPYSLYRMGLRSRWEKTARELGALDGKPKGSFDDLIHDLDTRHEAYPFLKDAHNQISLISGIPTDSEKAARSKTSAIAMWLEQFGSLGKSAASKLHGKTGVDEITGTLRGATFHSLLGMYNPAQYLIQASGALIAISINPIHAAKAIAQSLSFQALDRMIAKNPGKMDEYLKWMTDKGIDVDGYRMWHNSGLKQGITSSNVDYETLWADLPYDASLMRRVMGNDTFFFKSGELVSARISFGTAYNRWKSLNKGKTPDNSDMQDILARTEQYRLNMSRANSAKFQSGYASIPTQFQQVNSKFMEKILGVGEFTFEEKIRMATGQAAFFGAMGIPIVGYITPVVMDTLGLNAENLSEEELTILRNGALTWFWNDFMDVNSVITGRMTLGGDILEKMFTVAVEPSSMVDLLAGPSWSIMDKSLNMAFNVRTALAADFSAEGMETNKIAFVTEVLAKSLAQFAGPAANTLKAYDMTHSKFYKNRTGKPLFEWTDNNAQTILFQALGYSPTEVQDYYEVNNRDGGMIPVGMSNRDAKRITFIMNMLDGNSKQESAEAALYAINAIKTKYNPYDQQKLMKQVMTLIKDPKNPWDKNLLKMTEEWKSELSDGWADMIRISKAKTNPRVARELEERGVTK